MAMNYQDVLREIARNMVRLKQPQRLLKMVTRYLERSLKLSHASIFVLDERKQYFVFVDSKGSRRFPVGLIKIDLDHPLVLWFDETRRGKRKVDFLSRRQLEEDAVCAAAEAHKYPKAEGALRALRDLNAELVVPAYYQESLQALLILGQKSSGEPFIDPEISFFQILAQDCSVVFKVDEFHKNVVQKKHELAKQIAEIARLRTKEQKTYYQIMCALAQEVHAKDRYTFQHISQVEELGLMTASQMGLEYTEQQINTLRAGLMLHDIGKIGIPDEILQKPGPLTDDEWRVMKTHPEKGAVILQPLDDFQEVAEIVRTHHERWDGSGYPRGLKADEIPLEARIVAVVDAFHAMISKRCYQQNRPPREACEELKRQTGRQFDPQVVEAFLRGIEGYLLRPQTEATAELAAIV